MVNNSNILNRNAKSIHLYYLMITMGVTIHVIIKSMIIDSKIIKNEFDSKQYLFI